VNVAVALTVCEPETPVKVMTYVPGFALLGNKIPETA
jgi:hypothetical protein